MISMLLRKKGLLVGVAGPQLCCNGTDPGTSREILDASCNFCRDMCGPLWGDPAMQLGSSPRSVAE